MTFENERNTILKNWNHALKVAYIDAYKILKLSKNGL